jgi:hypothetical protein
MRVDKNFLINILSRLNRYDLERLVVQLFGTRQEPFMPLEDAGEGVYCQPILDSYGDSIHSVFLFHFLPLEVFNRPALINIADPSIMGRLTTIRELYAGVKGQWGMVSPELIEDDALSTLGFLSSLAFKGKEDYQKILFPKYSEMIKRCGIEPRALYIGSCDSFVEKNPSGVEEALRTFISRQMEGNLSINIGEDIVSVQRFQSERNLYAGVLRSSKYPLEPVYRLYREEEILREFEDLIGRNASEREIESFLAEHYREIFGARYDEIATQLWLRFPEVDIANKNRRLDIFMRNSVISDWELFELKRVKKLTNTYRDVPVLASEVKYAMQQLKNYGRILTQDSVRRKLAAEGIECYQPSLHLVVDKKPQISHEQWRWLMASSKDDVELITLDNLITEMKLRIKDRYTIDA